MRSLESGLLLRRAFSKRGLASLAFGAVALMCAEARAQAERYPERPVRLVVPYTAGGTADVVARLLAERFGKAIGGSFIVENRPGAGATVGTGQVAKSEPDGYTLLVTTLVHALTPALFDKLSFDPDKDFEPIALAGLVPFVLSVNPNSAAKDLTSFIAQLRAAPGKYDYGSAGPGSPMHIVPELFKSLTATDAKHVPYRGEAPATADLAAGHITFTITPVTNTAGLIKSGTLRGLGVASDKRSPLLPDVPTMREAGLPGFEVSTWIALLAPAGTPATIVNRLSDEVSTALADPAFRARVADLGVQTNDVRSPAAAAAFIRSETARWAPVVRAAGAAQAAR
jgi:tripartite-type tricarboxylate transporter receptor subunit TctC